MVEHSTIIRGSCLCRAVAYAVSGRPGAMWHCHCVICRKLSGAACATHVEAMASDFSWLRGQGCITHYELSSASARSFCGTLDVIKNCHCYRDRKMTGAPHDPCLLAAASALRWLQGEALLVVYSLPEAPGFRMGFCRLCGTSLPTMGPNTTLLGIPAGALDNDPGARARYHIFCGAKAPWFEITDDLPQFVEYAPRGFDWRYNRSLGQGT